MCGIVGYIGNNNALDIVIKGMEKLEYRGYDSAGIAVLNDSKFNIFKETGRVMDLKKIVDMSIESNFAIGHTRWATHGFPTKENSHPHISNHGRFIIVHNGVIENYKRIKHDYLSDYTFYSKTDTEVIVNLIEYFSNSMSVVKSIRKTMSILEGSYALLIIDTLDTNTLYFVKNKSPLVLGHSDKGYIIASDLLPLVGIADSYLSFEDGVLGIIRNNKLQVMDIIGNKIKCHYKDITITDDEIEKGSYSHYMIKEINESPNVIRALVSNYFDDRNILLKDEVVKILRNADQINLVASGTSMYAAYMTKYYFEKFCSIPSEVFCASELVYSSPLITKKPVFVFLSQSGETADSISVIKKYKDRYPLISMTNSNNSSIAELVDYNLNLYAGKEIAVASTKTYLAQVALSAIIAAEVSGNIMELKNDLINTAIAIENVLLNQNLCMDVAKRIYKTSDLFYIGRGIDYWVSLEAALKLKEVSYIHAEAYPSGELKHGPMALLDENTPVIGIITQEGTNPIVRVNLKEAETRKAPTIVISLKSLSSTSDDIVIPNVVHFLSPLVTGVIVQLIAYYCGCLRNNDIDKPKNLAKSVTVE